MMAVHRDNPAHPQCGGTQRLHQRTDVGQGFSFLFPHFFGVYLDRKQLRGESVYFSSQVQVVIPYCGEDMMAGTRSCWSQDNIIHCYSQCQPGRRQQVSKCHQSRTGESVTVFSWVLRAHSLKCPEPKARSVAPTFRLDLLESTKAAMTVSLNQLRQP